MPPALEVGVDDQQTLSNWTVQMAAYEKQAFRELDFKKLMGGTQYLVQIDSSTPGVRPAEVLDDLFYHVTKPFVMAVLNRALTGHYGSEEVLPPMEYLGASYNDPVLWSGQLDVQKAATTMPAARRQRVLMVERILRAISARFWHRYLAMYPNTTYLQAVLLQLARLDHRTSEDINEATLRKALPEQMFDTDCIRVVVGLVLTRGKDTIEKGFEQEEAPAPPASVVALSPLLDAISQPLAPLVIVGPPPPSAAAESPAQDEDEDEDDEDEDKDEGEGQKPIEKPKGGKSKKTYRDFSFLLKAPGNNTLLVTQPKYKPSTITYKMLKGLYRTKGMHLTKTAMALAVRWTLGFSLYEQLASAAKVMVKDYSDPTDSDKEHDYVENVLLPESFGPPNGYDRVLLPSSLPSTMRPRTDSHVKEGEARAVITLIKLGAKKRDRSWYIRVARNGTERNFTLKAGTPPDAFDLTGKIPCVNADFDYSGSFSMLILCGAIALTSDATLDELVSFDQSEEDDFPSVNLEEGYYRLSSAVLATTERDIKDMTVEETKRTLVHVRNLVTATVLRLNSNNEFMKVQADIITRQAQIVEELTSSAQK